MNQLTTYEVVIRGHASERILSRLSDDFTIDGTGTGDTRLTGEIRDSAHLHGVITHLTALAIDIVSVTPVTTDLHPTTQPANERQS